MGKWQDVRKVTFLEDQKDEKGNVLNKAKTVKVMHKDVASILTGKAKVKVEKYDRAGAVEAAKLKAEKLAAKNK
jgi:hypothetical protein